MAQVNSQENLKKLAETLVNLTVKDVQTLTNILEEEHGIKAASVAPVVAAAPGQEAGASAGEEKKTFDVVLVNVGSQKLQVIKKIKELLRVSLKEAKEATEEGNLPNTLFTNEPKVKAEEIQKAFQEVGATIELK